MNEISDITGLGKLACSLVEKISNACGWLYQNDPKVKAESALIEEIKKSNLSAKEKCVLITNSRKIVKEYSNQKKIIDVALENLNSNSNPDKVDELWLNQFMDKSKLVSTDEVQIIWGKLLAEECNKPSTVPKSLLFVLEQMDSEDAKMFLEACSCTVRFLSPDDEEFNPVIYIISDHFAENTKISYESLFRLEELGLIKQNLGGDEEYQLVFNNGPVRAIYNDETYKFDKESTTISVGNVIFTKSGKALFNAINPPVIDHYLTDSCIPIWQKSAST